MADRIEIRRPMGLQITSDECCKKCAGSGLQLEQQHSEGRNFVEVKITVCSCVRLERKSKQPNQHTKEQS